MVDSLRRTLEQTSWGWGAATWTTESELNETTQIKWMKDIGMQYFIGGNGTAAKRIISWPVVEIVNYFWFVMLCCIMLLLCVGLQIISVRQCECKDESYTTRHIQNISYTKWQINSKLFTISSIWHLLYSSTNKYQYHYMYSWCPSSYYSFGDHPLLPGPLILSIPYIHLRLHHHLNTLQLIHSARSSMKYLCGLLSYNSVDVQAAAYLHDVCSKVRRSEPSKYYPQHHNHDHCSPFYIHHNLLKPNGSNDAIMIIRSMAITMIDLSAVYMHMTPAGM